MRLSQYVSIAGACSKRAASRLISAGKVCVNGVLADNPTGINGSENITLGGQLITLPDHFSYVIYNKPVGIDCNYRSQDPASLINHLDLPKRLFPVGRLDKDSHGLLLLTDDGGLCHRLLSPEFHYRKTYHVSVRPHFNKPDIDVQFCRLMEQGVDIGQAVTLPCRVQLLGANRFEIVLTQGLNRQIRKMSRALGYHVIDLQRVEISGCKLGELPEGNWRSLSDKEMELLVN